MADLIDDQVFQTLDADFINPKPKEEVIFRCNGTQITVSKDWCLPIPIPSAFCSFTFEFITEPGDINFGIAFFTSDGEEEIIEAQKRVDSDVNSYSGAYTIPTSGTLVLLWDNSYSWFTEKNLTLSVEVIQVTAQRFEQTRITHARIILSQIKSQTPKLDKSLVEVEDLIEDLQPDIDEIEASIAALKLELKHKKELQRSAIAEQKRIVAIRKSYQAGYFPVLFRTLNRFQLYTIFSFLNPSAVKLVCKHWKDIIENGIPVVDANIAIDNYPFHEDENSLIADNKKPITKQFSSSLPIPDKVTYTKGNRRRADIDVSAHSNKSASVNGNGKVAVDEQLSSDEEDDIVDLQEELKENGNGETAGGTKGSKLETLTRQLSSQHTTVSKRNPYKAEVVQYLKGTLSSMTKKEEVKTQLKKKIDDWKREFLRKHGREPSDEEKYHGLAPLFKECSRLRRSLLKEEKRIINMLHSITHGSIADL